MKLPLAIGQFSRGHDRWTKQTRLWIPEIGAEHRMRADWLKKDLDLEERARRDARNLQPSPDDLVLNEAQLDVCNRVFAGILMLNQFLAEQIATALDAARQRLPALLAKDDLSKRIEIEAQTVFAEFRGPLRQMRRRHLEAERNLRYFRNANSLNRSATYKDSHIIVVGIVLALLVVESLANGMLFRDIVRGGWVGGVFIATLISTLNVISGLLAGIYGWSFVGHVRLLKKILGGMAILVLHGGALYWNLLIAHFREVAEVAARRTDYDFNIFALAQQAAEQISRIGWFGLTTIFAWALFGLGILIHFLAAREGWDDIGDRYPDYMKFDRRAKESEAEFDELLVEMRAKTRTAAERVVTDAEGKADAGQSGLNAVADLMNLVGQREQEVRDSEDEWVAGGTQLLRIYRDINTDVRGEASPPPAYFSSYPTPEEYRRGEFGAGLMREGEVDRHVVAAERAKDEMATLHQNAAETIAANQTTITELKAEVNRVLAELDERVEAAEERATTGAQETAEPTESGNGA